MSETRSKLDAALDGPPISQFDPQAVAERVARHSRGRRDVSKRRDIQGLRMVAVVAVVANHLTGWPRGGFVGVDVFFVISGFLITGHLLREHQKRKTISLFDFYRRRIRRLFPAALTVTAVTIVAAWIVFTAARLKTTETDGLWATVFWANWHYISVGTDYFQSQGPVSPLQHYWSLSVEEQFYVVWPLTLMLFLLAARRLRGGRTVAGTVAAGLLIVASLTVAVAQSTSDPVVAYFSTFTRGWELGLGALLAVLAQTARARHVRSLALTTAASWTGLALIGLSFAIVNQNHFPYPGALLPCLGCGLAIMGWSERAPSANFLLTNRVSNYIGDISYSVYVVHFPVIVIGGVLISRSSFATDTALLLLIAALSIGLFHLIEDPIRRSNWLKPKRERGQYVTTERANWHIVVVGAGMGVASLVIFTLRPVTDSAQTDIAAAISQPSSAPTAIGSGAPPPPGPQVKALDTKIRAALLADSWPKLNPPLGKHENYNNRGCGTGWQPASACTWGDPHAAKAIYLVGDSTSEAYTQAFTAIIPHLSGWRLRAAGGSGCPFADRVLSDGPKSPDCGSRNDKLVAEIEKARPTMVVDTTGVGNVHGTNSTAILGELQKIKPYVGTIVLLPPEPAGPDPNACYTQFSKPSACVGKVDSNYQAWLARNAQMAQDVGGTFIDPTSWYCIGGVCPIFVGSTPMRKDAIHLTGEYSTELAPVVLEAFKQEKLLG